MTLSTSARDALIELDADVNALFAKCDDAFFTDDEDVCKGVAGEGRDFIIERSLKLLAKIDAGDTDAAVRMLGAIANIRVALADEARRVDVELTAGAFFRRFADDVIVATGVDVEEAARRSGSTFARIGGGFFIGAAFLAGGIWLVGASSEHSVRRVKRAARERYDDD